MARKLYKSSDYAGMDVGKFHFYYGYEERVCKRPHRPADEGDCDHCEDAFVVKNGKREVMRLGTSKIEKAFPDTFSGSEPCEAYLLAGIGLWLQEIDKGHKLYVSLLKSLEDV